MGPDNMTNLPASVTPPTRILLGPGPSDIHPRVLAARSWLETNFHPPVHPGQYAKDREMNRQAVYFYYSLSLAKAFNLTNPKFENRNSNWAEELAEDLLSRQQSDGSWINSAVAVREDDPIVATCLAAQALALCR